MKDSESIKSDEVAQWHPGFPTSRLSFASGSETQLLRELQGLGEGGYCLLVLLSTGTGC